MIGVTYGLRLSDLSPAPRLGAGWRAYTLELHSRFGDDGPTFLKYIKREHLHVLEEVFGAAGSLLPVSILETSIKDSQGESEPIRLLTSNAEIAQLVPEQRGKIRKAECGGGLVLLDRHVRQRLGLSIGETVHVAGRTERVGPDVSARDLRILPNGIQVGGFRCVDDPFVEVDTPIKGALFLLRPGESDVGIRGRLDALGSSDGAFQEHWTFRTLEQAANQTGQRRFGWLLGLEILLGVLTIGVVVLLRILTLVTHRNDIWLRYAIGEQLRHRMRRHFLSAAMQTFVTTVMAIALAAAGALALVNFLPGDAGFSALFKDVLLRVCTSGLLLGLIRFSVDMTLDIVLGRRHRSWSGARATQSNRPALLTTMAAAMLCAGVCVPSCYLVAEFARVGSMSPGYRVAGLYSVHLELLDHASRSQSEWWERLQALRNDVANFPGVAAGNYISPAPWDFAGTVDVVAGEEGMIIDAAVGDGSLALLSPTGWNGREISEATESSELVIQNLDAGSRRNFIRPGETVIDEISGFRFSPLDETGRPAIIRSLKTGVGTAVHLMIRSAGESSFPAASLAKILDRYRGVFAAGPFKKVEQVLDDRLAPVRTSTALAMVIATIAILLLAIALLASTKLYAATHQRELAVRMCLGGEGVRLQSPLVLRCMCATAIGWALGTMIGLLVWHQIVDLIKDHRLTQPWPSYWLLPVALALVLPYYWLLTRMSLRRISISDALKA